MTRNRSWRRRDSNPDTDPALVFRELQARQLRDIETCRQAWEQEGDPAAVLEAVRAMRLPDWLSSAIVVLVTDGEAGYPAMRRRLWLDHSRAMTDRARVFQIAGVRTHTDATWRESFAVADRLTRGQFDDMPTATAAGLKRAYQRVSTGLKLNAFRYYVAMPGFAEFIERAWTRQLEVMKAAMRR
jgi:hypothetical protein